MIHCQKLAVTDTFILKFALVSEFHRHKTDDRKLRGTIFACLNFYAKKSACRETASRNAPRGAT